MKAFWIYNGLRFVVFAATLVVVIGVWLLIHPAGVNVPIALIASILLSGVISLKLLEAPRKRWAEQIEARATRAKQAFEAHKAREDDDPAA